MSNTRVAKIRPLIPPAVLLEEQPVTSDIMNFVGSTRRAVANILSGKDDRLVAIVGPCSIHDVKAAREYATKLAHLQKQVAKDVFVVMRVYFEKPRTTIGWKGLINDPNLDNSFAINKGMRTARQLLLNINSMQLGVGCELLDTISPQWISDLMSWGAIGARTTESQLHRELVSGLSMPVGFKNGSSGDIKVACDAMISASHGHSFLGVSEQGLAAIVQTTGNTDTHIILRGGYSGPNFDKESIAKATKQFKKAMKKKHPAIVVDCSHGNSLKDHKRQILCAKSVAEQVAANNTDIVGVMVESFLEEGNQKLVPGKAADLVYGKSITDKCVGWEETVDIIQVLAESVRARRKANAPRSKL